MALRLLTFALVGHSLALSPRANKRNNAHQRPRRDPLDQSWKTNIKNVVVLVEENRSFDTFAGGLDYNPAIDGLVHHNYCNSMNASDPNEAADVCAGPLGWDVASDDPNHSISGVNMQGRLFERFYGSWTDERTVFSTYHPDEATVNAAPAWQYENMRGYVQHGLHSSRW
jgi:phospholipase C